MIQQALSESVASSESSSNARLSERPEYVIDIRELSKIFRRGGSAPGNYTTLKSMFMSRLRSLFSRQVIPASTSKEVVKALHDVTLRIPKGSSVGIIGRNGSGKSTLLKLITGIYRPTAGQIRVHGSLAALIELGAGFHPDFTGRENVILGGVMQGLRRAEIEALLPTIAEFAELEHCMDEPVRTYSSGMFMRLGFSLSVHLEPEILLVDEVLAVGDAGFVRKCKERIEQMRKRGITLLLVTHDLDAVERWCDEALWLDAGEVQDRGDPRRVIDAYRQFIESAEEKELQEEVPTSTQDLSTAHLRDTESAGDEAVDESPSAAQEESRRWGSREAEIVAVRLKNRAGSEHQLFHPEDGLEVEIDYLLHQQDIGGIVFGIGIHKNDGAAVFGTNSDIEEWALPPLPERGTFTFSFEKLPLASGRYTLDVAVHRTDGYPFDYHRGVMSFAVRVVKNRVGLIDTSVAWRLREEEFSE